MSAFTQRKKNYFIVIFKSISIDWKVAKGECVHDSSSVRGIRSEKGVKKREERRPKGKKKE